MIEISGFQLFVQTETTVHSWELQRAKKNQKVDMPRL